jgi:hypothetical protein
MPNNTLKSSHQLMYSEPPTASPASEPSVCLQVLPILIGILQRMYAAEVMLHCPPISTEIAEGAWTSMPCPWGPRVRARASPRVTSPGSVCSMRLPSGVRRVACWTQGGPTLGQDSAGAGSIDITFRNCLPTTVSPSAAYTHKRYDTAQCNVASVKTGL